MPEPDVRVRDLAAAVADGAPVDWDTEAKRATSDEAREHLDSLRLVARIADVHGAAGWADRSSDTVSPEPSTAESSTGPFASDTWGPLRLLELIGHGSFGEVYRAWDPRLDREVALKLLRVGRAPSAAAGAALDALVVHEARLMARVRHPGVATIYGADRVDDRTGLWMELIRGETLEEELVRQGPLSAEAVTRCGADVADALAAVHRAGLLHRDVKTQNVMRDADGRLVLMDFGTGLEGEAAQEPRALAGTPLYLAPELLQGAAPTARSDLYSLGVVLFRLATGEYPVPGRTLPEMRDAHARGLRIALGALRPDLPLPLTRAIDRALSSDPHQRFASATDMREALIAGAGAPATWRRWAAVGGTALLSIGVAWFGWNRAGSPGATRAGLGASTAALSLPSTELREISPDPDVEDSGAPSPDGTRVSYTEDRTGHLGTYEVATRVRATLTGAPGTQAAGRATSSRFSRDGRNVAFVWRSREVGPDEVRAVPVAGGTPRRLWLAPADVRLYLHVWSSDRDELVLLETGAKQVVTLVLIDARTGSRRPLREFGWRPPLFVSRSPDARWLAFDVAALDTGLRDVHVLDLQTGLESAVVDGPASDHSPVWTEDGSRLVFLGNRTGTLGVWTVPVVEGRAAGRPVELEANVGAAHMMGLAGNGSLFLGRQVRLRNVYLADFDPATRTLVGEPKPLSSRSGWNGASDWAPDGRRLVFFRRDEDRYRLIVKDLASGAERELGDDGIDGIQRPRWSRDGRAILFWTDYKGDGGLFRLDVATGSIRPAIVDPRFSGFEPIPHTNRVVYQLASREFRIRALDTGEDRALHSVDAPFRISGTAVSRDGHWLAYVVRAAGYSDRVHLVDLNSGAVRPDRLLATPDERVSVFEWTPEGDAVFVVTLPNLDAAPPEPLPANNGRLLWVDVATGQRHSAGLTANGLRVLRLSPDGRHMTLDIGNPLFTVWTLEHFLP